MSFSLGPLDGDKPSQFLKAANPVSSRKSIFFFIISSFYCTILCNADTSNPKALHERHLPDALMCLHAF